MNRVGIIYIIKNKVNNKLYIGQTKDKRGFKGRYPSAGKGVERVYKLHKYRKERGTDYNTHLLKAIEKYGYEAFEVIEEFDVAYSKEELDKLEDLYIKIYNTIDSDFGYNNKYGGANGIFTDEVKLKISEKVRGKNHPMYGKKGKLNPNYGRKKSEEEKLFIKERQTGEDNSFYGKHHTEETKQKLSEMFSGENNPMYGRHHTEETKERIRQKNKNNKPKNNKIIYCEELGEFRDSAMKWGKELNCDNSEIGKCCKGKIKHVKGYHFRYATEEEIKSLTNK